MFPVLLNVLVQAQTDRINFTATPLERGIHFSLSFLLMLMWSIPVLIYAILFFPELKQYVRRRGGVHLSRKDESDSARNELLVESLVRR